MSKKQIALFSLSLMAVLAMSVSAFAGPGWGRGGGPQLTPEKQAAAEKIFEKYQVKFVELREQLWAKHTQLQAQMSAEKPDQKTIEGLTDEIVKLRMDMYKNRTDMRDELTKETGLEFGSGAGGCPGQGGGRGGCGGPGYGARGGCGGPGQGGYGAGPCGAGGCPNAG